MPRDCRSTPSDCAPVARPPGAPAWMTNELLTETLAVWQPFYAQTLTEQDAVELLRSASRLLDALGDDDEADEEVRGPGPG